MGGEQEHIIKCGGKVVTIDAKFPETMTAIRFAGNIKTIIDTNYDGLILPEKLESFRFFGRKLSEKILNEIKNLRHLKILELYFIKFNKYFSSFDFDTIPESVTDLIRYDSKCFTNQKDEKFLQFTRVEFMGSCDDLHRFKNIEHCLGFPLTLERHCDLTLNKVQTLTNKICISDSGFSFSFPKVTELEIICEQYELKSNTTSIKIAKDLEKNLGKCKMLKHLTFELSEFRAKNTLIDAYIFNVYQKLETLNIIIPNKRYEDHVKILNNCDNSEYVYSDTYNYPNENLLVDLPRMSGVYLPESYEEYFRNLFPELEKKTSDTPTRAVIESIDGIFSIKSKTPISIQQYTFSETSVSIKSNTPISIQQHTSSETSVSETKWKKFIESLPDRKTPLDTKVKNLFPPMPKRKSDKKRD